jgi:Transposase DDE domain
MRRKFDTPQGRATYAKRMKTVEPVFANLQNKGMRRFTLRGRTKVNAQWQPWVDLCRFHRADTQINSN